MKKVCVLILLILACLNVSAGAESEKTLFDDGVRLFKQEKYEQALKAFTRLIELNPQHADAYKNRGVTYMKQEKFDEAISDFQKAKQLFPELRGLYSNLGVAWYYKKNFEKAIESYDMEIAMAPNNHIAYFNRALCLAELDRPREALEDLKRTLELQPDFYWAICYKADILAQSGDHDAAIATYEEAISQNPDIAYAREKLASLKKQATSDTPEISSPAFEIQVGAFLNQTNALRMKKRLATKGFSARVLTLADTKNRDWYLVRSGNYHDEAAAQAAAASVKQDLGITPVIRPYGTW